MPVSSSLRQLISQSLIRRQPGLREADAPERRLRPQVSAEFDLTRLMLAHTQGTCRSETEGSVQAEHHGKRAARSSAFIRMDRLYAQG
jgi:hypothetical protein